jgi:hypothetical protein
MTDSRYTDAHERLWQSSYNLEVQGDMLRNEAREFRDELRRLDERWELLQAEGRESQVSSEMAALAYKLEHHVEADVRSQIDAIRQHTRTLHAL